MLAAVPRRNSRLPLPPYEDLLRPIEGGRSNPDAFPEFGEREFDELLFSFDDESNASSSVPSTKSGWSETIADPPQATLPAPASARQAPHVPWRVRLQRIRPVAAVLRRLPFLDPRRRVPPTPNNSRPPSPIAPAHAPTLAPPLVLTLPTAPSGLSPLASPDSSESSASPIYSIDLTPQEVLEEARELLIFTTLPAQRKQESKRSYRGRIRAPVFNPDPVLGQRGPKREVTPREGPRVKLLRDRVEGDARRRVAPRLATVLGQVLIEQKREDAREEARRQRGEEELDEVWADCEEDLPSFL